MRAVIAESFERIHRSNLVGMGVAPFEFLPGTTRKTLGLKGDERITIRGLTDLRPRMETVATIAYADGRVEEVPLRCRVDTAVEVEYMENGGVLHTVLRNLARAA
ncbi:Aconitase A [Rubellimicrobium thermophilum DSM 16684]|uniref:Aconitase A n=1 Tax=Rubellimicrobium thermophilum DSM 16684 TaxID=1123069 RepID=S9R5M7_9RHOB|nr:Aconitase A [Rubellimicrobium thermophilum DSM 16684]